MTLAGVPPSDCRTPVSLTRTYSGVRIRARMNGKVKSMEASFWKSVWTKRALGFHLPFVHPILKRSLPLFDLAPDARLFLPLCGKTLDIAYLLSLADFHVTGIELSEIAIGELFEQLNLEPLVSTWHGGRLWRSGRLRVFEGDFFELTPEELGPVALTYDRAALVALPADLRARYAQRLVLLTDTVEQLLISFEYDQSRMPGPPFAVTGAELERLYGSHYRLQELSRKDVIANQPAFLERGLQHFEEVAWRMIPR